MGYGSRKDVKSLVKKKRITVNNQIITKADIHVDLNQDQVMVDNVLIDYKKYIYLMLHKPAGYLSATEDQRQKTVLDLIKKQDKVLEPFPVGRLDKDTEGLLLLTNDGQLAHELLSPKKHVEKTYMAKLAKHISEKEVKQFEQGVILDDGYMTKPAKLRAMKDKVVEITITEGKFHQIKRMFKAVDNKVVYLKRLSMGGVFLDDSLNIGEYRELTAEELKQLRSK